MRLCSIVPRARQKGYVVDCFDKKRNQVFALFTDAAAIAEAARRTAIFATTLKVV